MGNCCVSSRELHNILTLGYYVLVHYNKRFSLDISQSIRFACVHDTTVLLIYCPLLSEMCHQEM